MEDHELSNLATHLHTLVSKFRVNANGGNKQRKQSDAGDEYSSSQDHGQEDHDREMAEV
jgi:hypothetical protein